MRRKKTGSCKSSSAISRPSSTAARTKSLIIVAPPRALGVLRQAYSHNLRTALRAEIDKDFVKLPVHEIEKHLAAQQ